MKILKNKWEFGVLEIDNYNFESKFKSYYNHIRDNHKYLEGDIIEIGVYKGFSLLATALLLKELGSDKKVYGFDSFSGFPPILNKKDSFDNFDKLFNEKRISKSHLDDHKKLLEYTKFKSNFDKINPLNISTSSDFSNTSKSYLEKKIDFLELDNVILIEGDFSNTMIEENFKENRFFACLFDCDLYESYKTGLNFVWNKLVTDSFIFFDEYYSLKFPGARIAVDEFFSNKNQKLNVAKSDLADFERWTLIKK